MAPTVRVSIFSCFGRKIIVRVHTVITARLAVCVYKMGHVSTIEITRVSVKHIHK